jgi:hypothetical protein
MNYNTNIKVFEIIKVAGYEIHKFEMVSWLLMKNSLIVYLVAFWKHAGVNSQGAATHLHFTKCLLKLPHMDIPPHGPLTHDNNISLQWQLLSALERGGTPFILLGQEWGIDTPDNWMPCQLKCCTHTWLTETPGPNHWSAALLMLETCLALTGNKNTSTPPMVVMSQRRGEQGAGTRQSPHRSVRGGGGGSGAAAGVGGVMIKMTGARWAVVLIHHNHLCSKGSAL